MSTPKPSVALRIYLMYEVKSITKGVMPVYEIFLADRLAQLRMQKGVSARDMSLSLGQANNYINNIENKKSFPSIQSFFVICEYLQVTPKEFFDTETVNPTLLNVLVEEEKHLDDTALTHLLGVVREMRGRK